ncbi:MAG: endolytic transglycosylase MltG [Ilumatobacteraceae bacterium]|nr:endolytic transglycosylase MltG [Ilumatobacteraceae bacterium]
MALTLQPDDWDTDGWDDPGRVPVVERPRRQTRIIKWLVWTALAAGAVAILVAGMVGWWYVRRVNAPSEAGATITFTVNEGDTVESIAARLADAGLIADEGLFQWYVERNEGLTVTPGYYQIPTGAHMGDVQAQLNTPPALTYSQITFPEGFTVEQMAERLGRDIERLSADEFLTAATSGAVGSELRPPWITTMEGLLFPDTYQVSNSDSEAQVVERMAALMERVAAQEDLEENARELLRTPYEVLIVASLVEREAKVEQDRPKIAQVIWNRIAAGQKLQIDASVYYGQDPTLPFPVLRTIDSPYNTYLYEGLPPTPIANPGRASIRAAATARPGDLPPGDPLCQDLPDPTTGCRLFYYVLADADGRHAFAVTLEQHEENIQAAIAAGVL